MMASHHGRRPAKVQSLMDALVRKAQRENDEELLERARQQPVLASITVATGDWYAVMAYERDDGQPDYWSARIACWGIFELPADPELRSCAPIVCDGSEMVSAQSLPGFLGVADSVDDVEQPYWLERAREWAHAQQTHPAE